MCSSNGLKLFRSPHPTIWSKSHSFVIQFYAQFMLFKSSSIPDPFPLLSPSLSTILLLSILLLTLDNVIDIRDALRKILVHLGIPLTGNGFHTFSRSGANLAYDNNVDLQHTMGHGLWRSSAVWTYLQNASQAPSIVPLTFASIIPSRP